MVILRRFMAIWAPPYLFKFPSKSLLSSHNNCNMIFLFDNLNSSTRNFSLNIVATLHRNKLIIFAVKYVNITFHVIVDGIQVPIKLVCGATNDVVQRVPCSIMCVAKESFKQESPDPVKYISPNCIKINRNGRWKSLSKCLVQMKFNVAEPIGYREMELKINFSIKQRSASWLDLRHSNIWPLSIFYHTLNILLCWWLE